MTTRNNPSAANVFPITVPLVAITVVMAHFRLAFDRLPVL